MKIKRNPNDRGRFRILDKISLLINIMKMKKVHSIPTVLKPNYTKMHCFDEYMMQNRLTSNESLSRLML